MRNAQATLEFLSKYGWTFLMIAIIIAGLVVFGIKKPRDILPDRCVMPAGFTCSEYAFNLLPKNNVNATVLVKNNFGSSITITNISMMYEHTPLTMCWHDALVPNQEFARLSCLSTTKNVGVAGERGKVLLTIFFIPSGKSLNEKVSGNVYATVQ